MKEVRLTGLYKTEVSVVVWQTTSARVFSLTHDVMQAQDFSPRLLKVGFEMSKNQIKIIHTVKGKV